MFSAPGEGTEKAGAPISWEVIPSLLVGRHQIIPPGTGVTRELLVFNSDFSHNPKSVQETPKL